MKKLILALVVLLSFALLFGCTSAPENNDSTDNQINDAMDNEVDNTVDNEAMENKENEVMENEETMETNDDSKIFEDFVALLSKLQNYKANYDVTAAGQSYELIQYVYNGEIRSDVTAQGVETRTFILESGIKTCFNMGSWSCMDAPESAEQETSNNVEEIKANPDKYKEGVTKIDPQTIIGQSTSCFNITGEDFEYDYCLNSNGVPLLIEGTSNGNEYSQIATAYTTSVSASDLELPAGAEDFEFPAGYPGQ